MKPRFSLRALLLATTLVGVGCWWRVRPTRVARDFVSAVNAGEYKRADKLFADPAHAFIAEFMTGYRNQAKALSIHQTVSQWLAGQCEISVDLVDHRGLGANMRYVIPVTTSGLQAPRSTVHDAGYTGFDDARIER